MTTTAATTAAETAKHRELKGIGYELFIGTLFDPLDPESHSVGGDSK